MAAERDRRRRSTFARRHGMAVHPPGTACAYNWDGAALDGATEAYVILHEVAHYLLAPPERRALPDFGLGPGPDTRDRAGAERAAALPVHRARGRRGGGVAARHFVGGGARPAGARLVSRPELARRAGALGGGAFHRGGASGSSPLKLWSDG